MYWPFFSNNSTRSSARPDRTMAGSSLPPSVKCWLARVNVYCSESAHFAGSGIKSLMPSTSSPKNFHAQSLLRVAGITRPRRRSRENSPLFDRSRFRLVRLSDQPAEEYIPSERRPPRRRCAHALKLSG